jgi:hypothetical protein
LTPALSRSRACASLKVSVCVAKYELIDEREVSPAA